MNLYLEPQPRLETLNLKPQPGLQPDHETLMALECEYATRGSPIEIVYYLNVLLPFGLVVTFLGSFV